MTLSEAQVRHRLNFLKLRGFLQTKRGRAGINLTSKGWEIITTNLESSL